MAEPRRIRVWVQTFQDRASLQLQWLDPATGKRHTRSARTSDPRIAEDRRADLEAELNRGGPGAGQAPLAWAAFRQHLEAEHAAGLRPNTQANLRRALDAFEEHCTPTAPGAVTERDLSAFAGALRQQGLAPSSIRVHLAFLRSALAWAKRQKLLSQVPDLPEIRVPRKRPQAVPESAWETLLAAAGDDLQLRAYLLTGWLAGLRLREALRLQWHQQGDAPYLDLEGSKIRFPAEGVKGQADQWVPLAPALRAALEALPRREGDACVFRFERLQGGPLSDVGLSRRIIALAQRAGLKLSMRALRRGFGCRHAARQPAQVLQRLMRHASIQTTVQFYVNVDLAAERAVLEEGEEKK